MNAQSEAEPKAETSAMKATYARVYTDEKGETHFADLSAELLPQDFAPPAGPLNVAQWMQTTDCYFVAAEPDWAGGTPHPSPQRQIFCVLRGCCVVTVSDGESRRAGPGDVILLDDTSGKGHSSRVAGAEPLLLLGIRTADQSPQRQ